MILSYIFFFISGFLGLLISVLTFKNLKSNKIMNIYFIVFLCILSLRQLIVGILFILIREKTLTALNELMHLSVLGLPIIYLYIKKMSNRISNFEWKEFIEIFIVPSGFFLIVTKLIDIFYNKLNIDNEFVLNVFPFIFSSFYIYLCFKILSKEIWSKKDTLITKTQNRLIKSWTKLLFISLLIAPLKFLLILLFELLDKSIWFIYYYLIAASSIILILSFKILFYPEILYGFNRINEKIKEIKKSEIILDTIWKIKAKEEPNNLPDKKIKNKIESNLLDYIEKIEKIVLVKVLLIKPGVTINDLSISTKIPKSHLHYLFKYHTTVTFIEFKKIIRIHYAKELIKDDFLNSNTLNSLSEKVGFSSYDPFYRSFKKITGNGPQDYYNYIKNM